MHLFYIFAERSFDQKFYTLRIASLGAFIAFRLTPPSPFRPPETVTLTGAQDIVTMEIPLKKTIS